MTIINACLAQRDFADKHLAYNIFYTICVVFPLCVNFLLTFRHYGIDVLIELQSNDTDKLNQCGNLGLAFNISGYIWTIVQIYTFLYFSYIIKKLRAFIVNYTEDRKCYVNPFVENILLIPFHIENVPYYSEATNYRIQLFTTLFLGYFYLFSFVGQVLYIAFCGFIPPWGMIMSIMILISLVLDVSSFFVFIYISYTEPKESERAESSPKSENVA